MFIKKIVPISLLLLLLVSSCKPKIQERPETVAFEFLSALNRQDYKAAKEYCTDSSQKSIDSLIINKHLQSSRSMVKSISIYYTNNLAQMDSNKHIAVGFELNDRHWYKLYLVNTGQEWKVDFTKADTTLRKSLLLAANAHIDGVTIEDPNFAIVSSENYIVPIGQKFQAQIFLGSLNQKEFPDKILVNGQPIKVSDGVGNYEIVASKPGRNKFATDIIIKDFDIEKHYSTTSLYFVFDSTKVKPSQNIFFSKKKH